jgi:hypothetical protein
MSTASAMASAAPARGKGQPRKCRNPHCSRLVSPPARFCDTCKKRSRRASRAGSSRIARGGARRVLSAGFTAPASSPVVANAGFYSDRSTGYGSDGGAGTNTEE